MRKSYGRLLLAAVVALGLQACGGGGGGGGGGVGALGLGGLPTVPSDAVTMTVSVNGKVVTPTPPASGKAYPEVRIKAGDRVEFSTNLPVRWTPQDDHGFDEAVANSDYSYADVDPRYGDHGFLKFRNLSITGTKWSAQIVNIDPGSEQGWPIIGWLASIPSGGSFTNTQFAAVYLNTSPGDPRNGTYEFFSAGGVQKKLRLDFDAKVYELVGKDTRKLTGSFAADDKEPGSFVFDDKGNAAANIARFRLAASNPAAYPSADLIVGALKPEDGATAQPFIAMTRRAAPLNAGELAGTYNRFSVERAYGVGPTSSINQFRISGDGRQLELCTEHYVFEVLGCPPSGLKTYAVAATAPAGFWRATNIADSKDSEDFLALRVNGEVVVISAGKLAADPAKTVFRAGLPVRSQWRDVVAYGASTNGGWSKLTVSANATNLNRDTLKSDGSRSKLDFSIQNLGSRADLKDVEPKTPASENYIGIQSTNLSLLIGPPSPAFTGVLQIHLNDQ